MRKPHIFLAGVLTLACMLGTNGLGIPQAKTAADATAGDKAAIEALE
jgi:hypothetical protein